MIPLKMLQMQGARFSRNETYLLYVAVNGKLKQRSRWGIFSGIMYERENGHTIISRFGGCKEKALLPHALRQILRPDDIDSRDLYRD